MAALSPIRQCNVRGFGIHPRADLHASRSVNATTCSRRRADLPLLEQKFRDNLARRFAPRRRQQLYGLLSSQQRLEAVAMDKFMDMLVA